MAFVGAALADFAPIALNPSSYNRDVVIEASAPRALNDSFNVTMDGGTNKNGNTWYERGYNTAAPTSGLPVAGSFVTNSLADHVFQMPPDYHVNNVIMVGKNNGAQGPLLANGTFVLTSPTTFSSLTFLTCSGNGPVRVGYRLHYADTTTEEGSFSATDWFNGAANVFNTAGLIGVGGGVNNVGAAARGSVFSADINVGNPAVNIVSVDFFFVGAGAADNPALNGRAVIFAMSGAKDGSAAFTNTIPVTGYTYDAVMEADGPQTTGTGVASGSVLTNNVSASMDGGASKGGSTWFEKGYYTAAPNTGIPAAGSSVTSAWYSARYIMPSSYVGNCAAFVASNATTANISFVTPAAYGALSFLGATANGDTFVRAIVQFDDGSSETNTLFVPDWFNRALPWTYSSFGRVAPTSRSVNNTAPEFINPFVFPSPYDGADVRVTPPGPRLFDAVINVTNTASAITNVALNFTNGISTRTISIFAVSGAPVGNVPPIFGAQGTPTPGQPNNAGLNGISHYKRWENTNDIVLSVTNIAGTGPITYQWKRAPRGGGFKDIYWGFDYSTFANVVNGGRVSGATSSALVISNASFADNGDYLVIASNAGGSITSAVATVMVLTTNQSILVGQTAGDIIAPIAADATPTAESIDHAIDRVAQKWLSDGLQFSGACCGGPPPFTGPIGFTVTPVSGGSIVTAMRFYAANDSQGRDPRDFGLEGSNDGATWTPIAGGVIAGTLGLPTGRNGTGPTAVNPLTQSVVEMNFANSTGYRHYRVTITNNWERFRTPLMQVGEVELLGTLVPNPPVIVQNPDPAVTVFVGASPSFTVAASGYPPARYQWYKNGATLIPGATNSTYTFPNAQLGDSGTTFHCVASNVFAQVPSSSATLTVIPAPTQSYPAAVLANNPIGYWRLNETDDSAGNNGAVTHDYRGGHNGYYSNTINAVSGYSPTSDPDTASQFGQTAPQNSYVANINGIDFSRASNAPSGGTFTVEAWAFGGNQTVDAAIVSKGYNGILTAGTGTGTEQFVLDVTGNPRTFRFLVRDAAGNGSVAQSSVVPFDLAAQLPTWRHLVGVCDQPGGKLYLYVDGLLAATGNIGTNVGILAQPLPMTIGARQSGGAAQFDNQWFGNIDDVALYNTALTAGQAFNHFLAGQRPPIITLQPTNQTTAENVSVTFASAAYGAGPVTYQWYLSDSVNPVATVPGQTSANLTFTTTAVQNGNQYQLVVSNPYGSTTGAVATLTVVGGAPSYFIDLPSADTFYVGHVIQLRVNVGGTAPFTYQWQKNGVNLTDNYRISGSQTNVLTIGYATNTDSGNYQVLVTGVGTTPSTVDAVLVTNRPSVAFNAAATGWTLSGSTAPPITANRLELTSGLGSTARAAFLTEKQPIGNFYASFVYQTVSGAGGADGVTFCIQNQAATAVGGGGGGLGYGGITPSVALALNIYDPNTRGIRLLQNGTVTTPFASVAPVLIGGNANPIQVNLTYGGGVLTAAFRDTVSAATFTTNFTVDIPAIVGGSTAYVGFTGADGGTVSTQVISNFSMSLPSVPIVTETSGSNLVLKWPLALGALLQSKSDLTIPAWSYSTATFRVVGNEARVTVSPLIGNQFYRLEIYP